jgi:iron complex outermembrane receptor protein
MGIAYLSMSIQPPPPNEVHMKTRHLPSVRLSVIGLSALACCQAAMAQNSPVTLSPVKVTDQADGYTAPVVSTVLRDAVPLQQIPQSVVSVTRSMIEDQGAQTMSDALKNVSNVRTIDPRDFYNTQFLIRGFRAATSLDGQAMPSMFANLESTINVERIDVIKGPAPSLNSGGQSAGAFGFVGGAVAVTSKSPEAVVKREVGVRVGNYREQGAFFDLNQPINEIASVRLVGEVQSNGSETDGVYFRRTSLFPSLSIKPGGGAELMVKLRSSHRETLDYSGLPPEGTVLPAAYTIARNLNIHATGQPDSSSKVDGYNIQWKQPINKDWSYELRLAQTNAKLDQNGVVTDDIALGTAYSGPNYFLVNLNLTQKVRSNSLGATVNGQADWAGVRHKLTLGVDMDRTTDYGYMPFGFLSFTPFNVTAPVYQPWATLTPNLPGAQDNTYKSTAYFVQDRVTLGNLHLLASLRHVRMQVDNSWPDFFVNNHTTNSKTTPRVGATFDLSSTVSTFVGYGESVTVPTNGVYTKPPKPEGSKQTEIGVKVKDHAGWNATIALFDLTRTNVATSDPANFGQSIQVGKQNSRGLDVDAQFRASQNLIWMGHYTHQTPRVTEDNTIATGNQIYNVPRTSARLAVRYDVRGGVLSGVGLGMGATYRSAVYANSANTYTTPAVTLLDAQASYQQGNARYALAVNNLTDRKYFEPSAYFGGSSTGHVVPALRRQVSFTASYAF